MAKDTTIGPVSTPEGGHYKSSEEIRMTNGELPQTEVMSEFDKDLAAMLVEGGYHSLFQLAHESDGALMDLKGVGLEELAVIREKAPYEPLIPAPAEEPVLIEAEIEVEVEEADAEIEFEIKAETEVEVEVEEAEVLTQADVTVEGEPDPDTVSQPVGEDPAVKEEELPELAGLEVGPVEPDAPKFGADLVLEVFGNKIGTLLIESGYVSLRGIAAASDKELVAIKGIGQGTLRKIRALTVSLPATALAPVETPQVSERVRRSMESAKSQ